MISSLHHISITQHMVYSIEKRGKVCQVNFIEAVFAFRQKSLFKMR